MDTHADYERSLKNLSEETQTLKKYAIEQVVTQGKGLHECMLCQRYSNEDSLGTILHILKSHKEILRLIKKCR